MLVRGVVSALGALLLLVASGAVLVLLPAIFAVGLLGGALLAWGLLTDDGEQPRAAVRR